ncbi:BTB/POZ domain-containing protein KCTD8-like [Diadema setosum]|uniref:BTB/POZ domain-containing protein KCTD8-like n=1 Tax=Diadema setosum TaxID=31175 RepID=UPI003B3AA9CC
MASYIGLNVGGKIYETSKTTLTRQPGSFFSPLVSGSIPSERDDQGNYRIDRDGEIFRYVLNYLRDNKLILPEGFNELRLLEREADFYLLESLKADIQALRVAMLSETISLNVGGTNYTTTREVLSHEPDSVFQQILKDQATSDSNGRFFIPGDGELFRYILKYLRFGFLALPLDFDLTSLEDEAKSLQLEVLLAHIMICRTVFQAGHAAGNTKEIVVMFARRDDFVLFSQDESILTSFSQALLTETSYVSPRHGIRVTWIGNNEVLVLPITLNPSRAGEPINVEPLYNLVRYPANRDELVALLSRVIGMETHRRLFTSSLYLGLFGSTRDLFSGHAVAEHLADIF